MSEVAMPGGRKVVSASLFATNASTDVAEKYWVGACMQALAVRELLPDYEFWIYVNDTVADYIVDSLKTLHARVIHISEFWEDSMYGYYWRFFPFGDDTVHRVYVCDVDLQLTQSEQHSIREWEASGASVLYRPWFHPIEGPKRAHEFRRLKEERKMLACALGVVHPFASNVFSALRDFFGQTGSTLVYGHDEVFLSRFIWPMLTESNAIFEVFESGIVAGRDMPVVTPSVLGKRKSPSRSKLFGDDFETVTPSELGKRKSPSRSKLFGDDFETEACDTEAAAPAAIRIRT